MIEILNVISVTGAFLFLFGLLFLIQRYTIGYIPIFGKQLTRWASIGDIAFCVTSLMYIVFYVDIKGPY